MIEAFVTVALRALAISLVLGALLSTLVLLATRTLALTAATRHALWLTALVATGLMPFAGVAASALRAAPAATPHRAAWAAAQQPARHVAPALRAPRHASPAETPAQRASFVPPQARFVPELPRLSHPVAVIVAAVWAAGALIGLAGLVLSVVRVRALKRRSSPLGGALGDELPWLTEVARGREVYLRLSYEIETPVAIGFRRPVILIPTDLATAGGLAAIETLVLHEDAHLRRHDDWTNLVQRALERLLWFHPIVWLAGRHVALEREIASDDAVVARTGRPKEYAASLWRLAREMRMPEHAVVAPGALLTRKQISIRIEQLLDAHRSRRHRSPATALAVAVASLAALAFAATGAPAVELPLQPPVAELPVQPPSPHARITYVYVHDGAPAHATVVRVAAHERLASAASPPPPAPVAQAMLPKYRPQPPLAPREQRAIDAMLPNAQQIEREVSESVGQMLAAESQALPGTGDMPPDTQRYDGRRVSREIVAGCPSCSYRRSDLHDLDLHGLLLAGADLRNADLRGARLDGATLTGTDLRNARLDGASLIGTRLIGVSLRSVSLAGVSLRSALDRCTGCDLRGLDLHGQDLHGITLQGADLALADLRDANMREVRFTAVRLTHADLSRADLRDARLSGCDLHGANLAGANTGGMQLSGTGADD